MIDVLSLYAIWPWTAPMALSLGALGWYAARRSKPRLAAFAPVAALAGTIVASAIDGDLFSGATVRAGALRVVVAALMMIPMAAPASLVIWFVTNLKMRPWSAGAVTGVISYLFTPLVVFVGLYASCLLLGECL